MISAMKIQKVLVTGASGKIGRNLIPALIERGYAVRAVQNRTPVEQNGVEIVRGSVSDYAFCAKALDGCDAVCHLATTKEDKPGFIDVSIRGTWNLLESAKESGHIRQFIMPSGDAAMGIFYYPQPVPISETMPLRAYPGVYAFSKVIEDTMVMQYGIQYGLAWTILRFSWIHDEDDILCHVTLRPPDFGSPWKSLAKAPAQKKYFSEGLDGAGCLRHPGGAPFKRQVVGIRDVVQSVLLALGNPRAVNETFHVAAPAPFSYDVLARYIGEKLGVPVVDFELPDYHDFEIDISKARSVLGYRPEYDVFRIVDAAVEFRKSGKARADAKYRG
jgi:UDP-glucose 4-epimerase